MKNVGELQDRIIEYLAQNPNRSKTEIANGLGYNHPGNVSKQTSKLETKQLVIVSSAYKVRGSKRERWGLTANGISYFIENSDYSINDLINIISIYKEQKSAELLYNILEERVLRYIYLKQ
jgi:predicted ArsR family transcriptional regulator